jgi:hypothetical protein
MEIVAIGLPLIGGAIWLTKKPSLHGVCFAVSAWFAALGDAAQFFKQRRGEYLTEARRREYLGAAVPEVQSNG